MIILAVLTLEMCWMGVWEQCAAPVNYDGPLKRFTRDCYNFEEPNRGLPTKTLTVNVNKQLSKHYFLDYYWLEDLSLTECPDYYTEY